MTRSSTQIAWIVPVLILFAVAGCRSNDPYCQQAIANLRAEKIQLENEYYALRSEFESKTGQTAPTYGFPVYSTQVVGAGIPVGPPIVNGQIIYDQPIIPQQVPTFPNNQLSTPPIGTPESILPDQPSLDSTLDQGADSSRSWDPNSFSRYITGVEVNQLPAGRRELTRLLIRPLDKTGAILPVSGDIKVRLVDQQLGSTIFEREYSRQQIANMIVDNPNRLPGIHLPVGADSPALSGPVRCDLQYLTGDQRILRQSINLVTAQPANSQTVDRARLSRPRLQNASSPILPDNLPDGLQIEIGEELNFDSLEDSIPERPVWRPNR